MPNLNYLGQATRDAQLLHFFVVIAHHHVFEQGKIFMTILNGCCVSCPCTELTPNCSVNEDWVLIKDTYKSNLLFRGLMNTQNPGCFQIPRDNLPKFISSYNKRMMLTYGCTGDHISHILTIKLLWNEFLFSQLMFHFRWYFFHLSNDIESFLVTIHIDCLIIDLNLVCPTYGCK